MGKEMCFLKLVSFQVSSSSNSPQVLPCLGHPNLSLILMRTTVPIGRQEVIQVLLRVMMAAATEVPATVVEVALQGLALLAAESEVSEEDLKGKESLAKVANQDKIRVEVKGAQVKVEVLLRHRKTTVPVNSQVA